MNHLRPVVLLLLCVALGCARTSPAEPESPLPPWLTSVIRHIEAEPLRNPPGFVARYEYKGQVTYFVPSYCCDVPSVLYAADGTRLCHPNGGFTGTGDGRCPDFYAERRNELVVWRDPRAPK